MSVNRDQRRQLRRLLEAEADLPIAFWKLEAELAGGGWVEMDGDALDRRMTHEAHMAYLDRRIEEHKRRRGDDT